MLTDNDLHPIGHIGKPHGVRGELQLHLEDSTEAVAEAHFIFCRIDGLPVPFPVERFRFTSDDTALVLLEGINDCDSARELTGSEALIKSSEADEGAEGQGWEQFKGYTLRDADGTTIGIIDDVDASTPNTLLCVGNLLIPAAFELTEEIDRDTRTLTMALPEGLTQL